MDEFHFGLVLLPEADSVGLTLAECRLLRDLDIDVLEIKRDGESISLPGSHMELRAFDELRVRSSVDKIRTIQSLKGLQVKGSTDHASLHSELVEIVIVPGSSMVGRSLAEVDFRNRFGGTAIAIRHHNELLHEGLGRVPLSSGDVLLVEVHRDRLEQFKLQRCFFPVSGSGAGWFRRDRSALLFVFFSRSFPSPQPAMILTEFISNTAAAVLISPLAIATATTLGLDPRPFLIAVMFAASASFMTPIGYQTNTMVYGPGQYRFVDFLRVGAPLNLLAWMTATIFIPILWPMT